MSRRLRSAEAAAGTHTDRASAWPLPIGYGRVMDQYGWRRGLALGWRQLWRDVRAGELRLLMLSVALAVAALTAVGFLADRIASGLWRDARQLLGGDAVVVSDQATPEALGQEAVRRGLVTNTSVSFPTMARVPQADGESRLVALKAVEPGYPLRGQLLVRRQSAAAQDSIPARGQVWVDPALLEALSLSPGHTLALGERSFEIAAVIEREPDRGAGFMNFAPRVLMNSADLAATALVQPASRVTWRMAVAGPQTLADGYAAWVRAQVDAGTLRGVQVESLESGRPEMRQTLDRASQFLHLVALLAALLCAVAVALAARNFAERQFDACALLRVLGQSQRTLTLSYASEFLGAGLLASLAGVGVGYGVHLGFVQLLQGLVEAQLPPASLAPALLGLAMGLTLLVAFGLPPVLQLARVPALRVLRRELGGLQLRSTLVLLLGLLGFALTLLMVSRDLPLGLITVGGFALALLLFAAMAAVALWALRRLGLLPRLHLGWGALRSALRAEGPRRILQVSSLSVGLLALALLVLLRTDLVASWRQATPSDAPDRFVINVQPDQAEAFLAYLREQGVRSPDWFPMVRGRLVAINGREVRPSDFPAERARRLVDREFNLSHSMAAPAHNSIVAGAWVPNEPQALSLEEGLAKTLGLKMGDLLRFEMAGLSHEARVTSIRRVDWTSMRANFFVMYPLAQMPDVPMTYIAAFRAPAVRGFDNALVARFPNITNVDLGASLNQVQKVLGQVVQAVEFLFVFTLAAGLVVMFAAVTATREERARDYAVLRALGASNQLLARMQAAELLGVGALAGALASLVALAVGWGLAHFVFEFAWTPPLWVPLGGTLAGAALALACGWWGLREILRRPVVQTLRAASH